MLSSEKFISALKKKINFFTGVPDSVLKTITFPLEKLNKKESKDIGPGIQPDPPKASSAGFVCVRVSLCVWHSACVSVCMCV